jgi:SAM-dependent methyltransferase
MPSGRESWLPNELHTAGRENLDPAHPERYDRKEDADAAREVAMLTRLGIDRDAVVVDLGAGTGQFALEIARTARCVVAVDVSGPMLDRLREKLARSALANVDCVRAGFLTYEHSGADADLVYSRLALHHLPDFWKAIALERVARMLRPGGILRLCDVVYGFEPAEARAAIERWLDGAGTAEAGWTRAELEEHVRDESSTFTWLLEPMLERAGFSIESADYSEDMIFARYLCRRS